MARDLTISQGITARLALAGLAALVFSAPLALDASAGSNGIQSLQAVSQLKAQQANAEARATADAQRARVQRKKTAREAPGEVAGNAEAVEDKMGNFEMQDLMSRYNQSEQLRSSVQKKQDDANNAVIQKID